MEKSIETAERVLVSTVTEQHDYIYASGKLLRETVMTTEGSTSTTQSLDFFYDANGTPYALKVNGTTYYYVTNLQGDVVRLVNSSGTAVASYEYDPYGNIISQSGTMAEINPLRYRGYYYDCESSLYYLQSRYYDPAVGRFINADTQFDENAGILGLNLFTYCANNPIMYKDSVGESLTVTCVLIGMALGALIGGYIGSRVARSQGKTIHDGWDYLKYVMGYGALGGAIGGLAGWAFAGTQAAATISWAYYKATTYIGTTAYAIGRAFERWFYKAYNIASNLQQVKWNGFRFDAIFKNSIIELKNYNWSLYSNYSTIIKSFVRQASNYMQFINQTINGVTIRGVTFCFSSKPPQEIIDALQSIGVTVNWL